MKVDTIAKRLEEHGCRVGFTCEGQRWVIVFDRDGHDLVMRKASSFNRALRIAEGVLAQLDAERLKA